jgi:NPCBM/NEW2 domain/Fibronectin type III domain/Dockerin type I domain
MTLARIGKRGGRRRNQSSTSKFRRLAPERLEDRWLLAATNILTYLGDLAGTGANTNESTLTPADVNTTQFGKQFTSNVDGQIYAQPLYMTGVNITTGANQGIHNVVFVATAHDSLYAFDADNGIKLWQTSFLSATVSGVLNVNPNIATGVSITSVPSGDLGSTDITPEVGVIATPVIDPATGTLYLTAKTKEIINGNSTAPDYFYQLYAINIQNGHLQTSLGGGVIKIGDTVYSGGNYTNNTSISVPDPLGAGAGAVGGVVQFNTLRAMDRTGLTLYNGQIYIGFASHGDNGPYHGWILAYNANNMQLSGVFNTCPNSYDGGIWQSGGRIEIDSTGALYFETGNGGFDSTLDANGFPINGDYGDSVVKLVVDPTTTAANPGKNGWGLKVADYFAPFNQANLNTNDTDMASSGLVILPDSLGNVTHPHLLIARGKSGVIYLLDRNNMGKFNSTTDQVVQEFSDGGGFWSSPTLFLTNAAGTTGIFYGTDNGGALQQWSISNAAFSTTVQHTGPDTYVFPGATGFISSNGVSNGIVWQVEKGTNQLRAYSAANVGTELYTTGQNSARDALGSVVKFSVPIADNGHVYVGTSNSLVVYGELAAVTQAPAAPSNLTANGLSAGQIQLTWTRNSTNEAGFDVERSIDNVNFTQVGLADAGATTFTDSNNLTPSTTYYYRIRAFNSIGNSTYSNVANGVTLLGIAGVWADSDVGTPGATGGASFASNTFTVSGSGNGIGNTSDNFHYVYQPLTGDGTIIARVQTQGNTSAAAKAGVMIRASLNPNSAFADVVATPGSGILFQDRTATGGSAVIGGSTTGAAPEWVMLVRAGNVITGYDSTDGVNYTKIGSATFSMAQSVFVGLAVTSNNDGTLSTATFNNINVFPPQTFASDLTPTSSTNGSGPIHLDKSQNGNTITLRGTTYTKGLGVRANSDVIYNLAGQFTSFISDIGIDDEVGASGAAEFQIFADGTKVYDSGSTLLTGGGVVDHIVVNVTGVTSLDLRVIDGAGNTNDHADWAAARLINGLPGAPNSLSGTVAGGSQINLAWADTAVNENGYKILREDPNTNTFHLMTTVPARATSFFDSGLTNGQTYSYEVQATNTVGDSALSNTVTVSIPTPPAAPTNLQLSQLTSTTVGLAWQIPPTNDQGVKIFRRDTTTSLYSLIATLPADTTSYSDTGLTPGSLHNYDVDTYNIGGYSAPASIQVTLLTVAPANPSAVSGNGHIQLNWTVPSGAVTYSIYRGTSAGGENATPLAAGVSTNSYTDTSVAIGTTYYYQITALDAGGESARSTEVHATYLAPVATIPSPIPNPSLVPINSLPIMFNEVVSGFTQSSLSLQLNNGANLLTPSQTLTTSDNQTFTLNNLSSLTTPVGTYVLTFTAAGSGVVDGVGNGPISNASTTFVITHAAPQVAAVYVSSSAWQQTFLNDLASSGQGDSQLGYRVPAGANQLGSLPWTNINIITVQFTEDVTINAAQAGLALTGSPDLPAAPALSAASFSYSSATRAATWVYRSALPLDKYLISIPSSAVTNGLGAALDGEFTTSTTNFPSGNGTAGGDFNFRFNILPGDVDQNGVVTGTDGGAVRQHFLQFPSSPSYVALYDTYGKGAITGLDLLTVQGALLTQLPTTDPTPPGQGGGGANTAASSGSAIAPAAATSSSFVAAQSSPDSGTSANSASATAAPTASTAIASTIADSTATAATTTTTISKPLAVDPDIEPAKFTPHDLVWEAFESKPAGSPASLWTVLGSVTSLDSLSLSSGSRHGGWLLAHDSLFAELDFSGPVSTTKRTSSSKRFV